MKFKSFPVVFIILTGHYAQNCTASANSIGPSSSSRSLPAQSVRGGNSKFSRARGRGFTSARKSGAKPTRGRGRGFASASNYDQDDFATGFDVESRNAVACYHCNGNDHLAKDCPNAD